MSGTSGFDDSHKLSTDVHSEDDDGQDRGNAQSPGHVQDVSGRQRLQTLQTLVTESGSRRGQGGQPRTKTTSRSAPMPHGIPIDAYMNKGPKSELIVLDRTRIGVLG